MVTTGFSVYVCVCVIGGGGFFGFVCVVCYNALGQCPGSREGVRGRDLTPQSSYLGAGGAGQLTLVTGIFYFSDLLSEDHVRQLKL